MIYRVWLVVAVALFLGGMLFGIITPESAFGFLARDVAALQDLSRMLAGLPPLSVAIFIFIKNAFALLLSFALSPLLCLMPIMALTVNGWLLGFVVAAMLENESLGLLLAGLLPHGIVEIPAFIIGEAAALSFGAMVVISIFRRESRTQIPARFKESLKYLALAVALLLPAAFIEAFVTAALVKGS